MDWPFPLPSYSYSKISINTGVKSKFYGIRVAKKLLYSSLSPYISLWGTEPPLPRFPQDIVVISPNSWHGRLLLSTTSPPKPPFPLSSPAKGLVVRDRHNKRLRVFIVLVRLFSTRFAVVLLFSPFSVKMAVFRISDKYPFINRNFEK